MNRCSCASLLALALLSLSMPVSATKAINGIGTEYAVYDAPGISFSPNSPSTEWYIPAQRLRTTVGLYNLDSAKVLSQLTAMRNSGQTDIAIPIWISGIGDCEYTSCNDGVYDGQWGEVIDYMQGSWRPQHKQNYQNLLANIKALGFKRIIIRFNQYWSSEANGWNEATYQRIWNFIVVTRNTTEKSLAVDGPSVLYDLGGELGGLTSGVNQQFTKRLWQDYTFSWGADDTVGFSFAWAPGRFTSMRSTFQQAGTYLPKIWAFDIYPHALGKSLDMRAHLQNIANEMGALNGQPIIVLETWDNDATTASEINSALNGSSAVQNLNLDGLFQWKLNKSRSLSGLDKHFSQQSLENLTSTTQTSHYIGLKANRRIDITNSNSLKLVLSDTNCATTSSVPCAITERWGSAPNGKVHVVSVRQNGAPEVLHACVTGSGSQTIPWIVPNQKYQFISRYSPSCSLSSGTIIAESTITLH